MDSTHLSCSQSTFGGCPGPDCERDCYTRRNRAINIKIAEAKGSMFSARFIGWLAVATLIIATFGAAYGALVSIPQQELAYERART